MEKYIKEEKFEIWIEDGIARYRYFKGSIIDLETARKIVELRLNITNRKFYPCFVDTREGMYMLNDAKQFLSTPYALSYSCAGAILINSHVMSIIANTFMWLTRPYEIPVKIFGEEKMGLEWLKQYRLEQQ